MQNGIAFLKSFTGTNVCEIDPGTEWRLRSDHQQMKENVVLDEQICNSHKVSISPKNYIPWITQRRVKLIKKRPNLRFKQSFTFTQNFSGTSYSVNRHTQTVYQITCYQIQLYHNIGFQCYIIAWFKIIFNVTMYQLTVLSITLVSYNIKNLCKHDVIWFNGNW